VALKAPLADHFVFKIALENLVTARGLSEEVTVIVDSVTGADTVAQQCNTSRRTASRVR